MISPVSSLLAASSLLHKKISPASLCCHLVERRAKRWMQLSSPLFTLGEQIAQEPEKDLSQMVASQGFLELLTHRTEHLSEALFFLDWYLSPCSPELLSIASCDLKLSFLVSQLLEAQALFAFLLDSLAFSRSPFHKATCDPRILLSAYEEQAQIQKALQSLLALVIPCYQDASCQIQACLQRVALKKSLLRKVQKRRPSPSSFSWFRSSFCLEGGAE